MLITVATYRAITGDTATPATTVSALVEQAEELLADALDRPLDEASRTEKLLPTRDGWVWPRATPIMSVAGEWTIDGEGLWGAFGPGWPDLTGRVEVTSTGGWVERTAHPTATNRLPAVIERDLAVVVHQLATTDTADYPAGATSVRLGDAAVTFGADGAPRPGAQVRWSRSTLAYRYRTARGA